MAYLPVAIPPLPEFIAFVPVDSVEAATKLIEKAPVVIRKDDEKEGRYEVIGPNRTFPILMRDGLRIHTRSGMTLRKRLLIAICPIRRSL